MNGIRPVYLGDYLLKQNRRRRRRIKYSRKT